MNIAPEILVSELKKTAAYPHAAGAEVVWHETHISWVFLVGECAYKVKKPICNAFLDYRALNDRRRYCQEEFRLNGRFAPDLYLGVVPITYEHGRLIVEGSGQPVEFAVKMHRFQDHELLRNQLDVGKVYANDVVQLAELIAQAHAQAQACHPSIGSALHNTLRNAVDNLCNLQPQAVGESANILRHLQAWTRDTFEEHESEFASRIANGFIRECHGDLHSGNIVRWRDRWVPFDGIEFNDEFRLIDVLSDTAFLSMDLSARGRDDLASLFINAYLEDSADRNSLALLRWYTVYRALVRAKVAGLRAEQTVASGTETTKAESERDAFIYLAQRLANDSEPRLFIMHGVSGSGKTTVSTQLVASQGAVRLRSDVERKRLLSVKQGPAAIDPKELYSDSATKKTYAELFYTAEKILAAGYSVVLDAAFLKLVHRRMAYEMAQKLKIDFAIVDCNADLATLRQRLIERASTGCDASDADIRVLEMQLTEQEPLTDSERNFVIEFPRLDRQA